MAFNLEPIRVNIEFDQKKFSRAMKSVEKETGRATKKMDRGFSKLNKSVKKVGRSIAGVAASVATFGAAAVALGAVALVAVTKKTLEWADELEKTATQLGISTNALQELEFAAKRSGVEISVLRQSLSNLERRIGEAASGAGLLVGQLQRLDPALLRQLQNATSLEQAFVIATKALAGYNSETRRLAVADALFSSTGRSIVRMSEDLEALRAEANRLGLIIPEDNLRLAEQTSDAITNLTSVLETKFKALLLSPDFQNAIKELTDFFTEILTDPNLTKKIGEIADKFKEVADGLSKAAKLTGIFDDVNFKPVNGDIEVAQDNLDKLTAQLDLLRERMEFFTQGGLRGASLRFIFGQDSETVKKDFEETLALVAKARGEVVNLLGSTAEERLERLFDQINKVPKEEQQKQTAPVERPRGTSEFDELIKIQRESLSVIQKRAAATQQGEEALERFNRELQIQNELNTAANALIVKGITLTPAQTEQLREAIQVRLAAADALIQLNREQQRITEEQERKEREQLEERREAEASVSQFFTEQEEAQNSLNEAREDLNRIMQQGLLTHERVTEELEKQERLFREATGTLTFQEQFQDFGAEFGKSIDQTMKDGISSGLREAILSDDYSNFFENLGERLANTMLDSILTSLTDSLVQSAFQDLFGGTGGGVGIFGAIGGFFSGFASGGIVPALPGSSPNRDSVPALLTPGERVLTESQSNDLDALLQEGSTVAPVVNLTIQAIDTQSAVEFLTSNREAITGIIQSDFLKNGQMRTLRGRT